MKRVVEPRKGLRERFAVNEEVAEKSERPDYYATQLPAGPARLGEMLEESASYSEQLQRISGSVMLGVLVPLAAVVGFPAWVLVAALRRRGRRPQPEAAPVQG